MLPCAARFIPRSQKLGRLEPTNLGDPQDIFGLVPEHARHGLDLTPVFQPMPAGSCTFHHGLTFHYAGPNTTARPRRAMVAIYMPATIHYTGQPHVVTRDLTDLHAGDPLAGDRFPVLAQEQLVGQGS